jgi:hypothetical protein
MNGDSDKSLCCRYCFSALLVRLGQYLLAVCLDVTPVTNADLKGYLLEKLMFGDQERHFIDSVVSGTVEWVRRALAERGTELPGEIDIARLFEHPVYADDFIELILRLLSSPDEAACLPLALEVLQFDDSSNLQGFPRLKSAADKGDGLSALVKGFIVRATGIPKVALDPIHSELRSKSSTAGRRTFPSTSQGNQLPLGDKKSIP